MCYCQCIVCVCVCVYFICTVFITYLVTVYLFAIQIEVAGLHIKLFVHSGKWLLGVQCKYIDVVVHLKMLY